jgi:hypothetical protein
VADNHGVFREQDEMATEIRQAGITLLLRSKDRIYIRIFSGNSVVRFFLMMICAVSGGGRSGNNPVPHPAR